MAEYGIGGSVSPQGDMYIYGILFLEMFLGKRPTEHMFLDGSSLHNFFKMALPERVRENADSNLLGESSEAINNVENQHDMEARIQVACSEESPRDRMDMRVACSEESPRNPWGGHVRMQLAGEGTSQLGD